MLKVLLERFGLRISHSGGYHRFDAAHDVFKHMRSIGFQPGLVIDGGANVGAWTLAARQYFPSATFHLIEPQPWLQTTLAQFAAVHPKTIIHSVALAEPGVEQVTL